MKYFLDTEFLEGTQKTLFGNTKPTIDLISIGIVCEDGREYYAISKDFNLKEAWNRYDIKKDFGKPQGLGDIKVYWIRDNALKPIWEDFVKSAMKDIRINGKNCSNDSLKESDTSFTYNNLKYLIKKYGKTNKQIAEEIKDFCLDKFIGIEYDLAKKIEYIDGKPSKSLPQFYAYYADYDWVAFCWLFGRMIDLPGGFPMYCIDLKQELSRKQSEIKGDAVELYRRKDYPKQTNEHNALADAKWNKELYEFLNTL